MSLPATPLVDARVAAAVDALSVPRAAPADSFVLHAPLELLARIGLLPFVAEHRRDAALDAIEALGRSFTEAGDPVDPPRDSAPRDEVDAAARLAAALREGDLDGVDAWATWLGRHVDHATLAALIVEPIVDSVAAAGHAPIGLHLLRRVAPAERWGGLLRQPLREIARHPDWRIGWFRSSLAGDVAPQPGPAPTSLESAVRAVPSLGLPGSNFVRPLMVQVEESGVADHLLAPVLDAAMADFTGSSRVLVRAATWSMLHDDEEQAPYGWTHCLTMPQAVLALAGRGVAARTAFAVAVTFTAGFRAGEGREPVGPLGDRDLPDMRPVGPTDPVSLATAASLHPDAHLVKYVLACLHAAEDDPAWAPAHLAAAAFLVDWWRRHPDA